jgi:formylglycine-generating enzyme required for sulfatase activity
MPFDLKCWRSDVRTWWAEHAPDLKTASIDSAYALLASSAWLPLLAAYAQDPGMATTALVSITAGIGSNLVANVVQNVYDWSHAGEQLTYEAQEDAEIRAELDAVLQSTQVLQAAHEALSDRWEDFARQLIGEMASMAGKSDLSVALGDGAVVGGSVFPGDVQLRDSVLVGRDQITIESDGNYGPIVTGNNNIIYLTRQYLEEASASPDGETLSHQIVTYLEWVRERFGTVALRGIERGGQQVVQLNLDTIYVPLEAEVYESSMERRSVPLDEILDLGRRLILTGGPGSGKTTVLKRIASTLADAIASDNADLARARLGLDLNKEKQTLRQRFLERLELEVPSRLGWDRGQASKLGHQELEQVLRSRREALERGLLEQTASADKREALRRELEGIESIEGEKNAAFKRIEAVGLPLPIFVPLSAYARHLRELPGSTDPRDHALSAFISRYLVERQSGLDISRDFFVQLLRTGKAIILLLDGLDEVSNESERVRIREAVEDLVIGRIEMRVLVTCRTAAYRGRTALGRGFRDVRAKALMDEHIKALIERAYADIYPRDLSTARREATDLMQGIHALERERRRRLGTDSARLVTSPLLVRMLLVVHFSARRLPEQRAELYMKATETMLLPEYAPDELVAEQIGGLVGGSREVHRELVQHLAFSMHNLGRVQGREISENALRTILADGLFSASVVDDFIALTRLRGTLLEERMGIYRFVHLSFQEYLAARYLAEVIRGEGGVEAIVQFLEQGPILDPWWREPTLLVAGYLSITSLPTAKLFLRRLAGVAQGEKTWPLSPDVQMAAASIAALACLEWRADDVDLVSTIAERIVALFRDSELMRRVPRELRWSTGDILNQIGDPRFHEDTWYLPKEPLLGFVEVPGGACVIGEGSERNEVSLPPYFISRYPVNVAQFRAFAESTGGKRAKGISEPRTGNHPVVDVTWYDAQNYCRWLEHTLRGWQPTPEPLAKLLRHEGWSITLPSEVEWEKAARGTDGRKYPWGESPSPNRANYVDAGIGGTTPVGCFPSGASPYGVEDLAGNVCEWTRSRRIGYAYDLEGSREVLEAGSNVSRVIRGCAFFDGAEDLRCTFRFSLGPKFRTHFIGFRLVVTPFCSARDV